MRQHDLHDLHAAPEHARVPDILNIDSLVIWMKTKLYRGADRGSVRQEQGLVVSMLSDGS